MPGLGTLRTLGLVKVDILWYVLGQDGEVFS
jgi:hypothetical protein